MTALKSGQIWTLPTHGLRYYILELDNQARWVAGVTLNEEFQTFETFTSADNLEASGAKLAAHYAAKDVLIWRLLMDKHNAITDLQSALDRTRRDERRRLNYFGQQVEEVGYYGGLTVEQRLRLEGALRDYDIPLQHPVHSTGVGATW